MDDDRFRRAGRSRQGSVQLASVASDPLRREVHWHKMLELTVLHSVIDLMTVRRPALAFLSSVLFSRSAGHTLVRRSEPTGGAVSCPRAPALRLMLPCGCPACTWKVPFGAKEEPTYDLPRRQPRIAKESGDLRSGGWS